MNLSKYSFNGLTCIKADVDTRDGLLTMLKQGSICGAKYVVFVGCKPATGETDYGNLTKYLAKAMAYFKTNVK